MLHLSEEEAIAQFEALLNQTSVLTAVFDVIHDWSVPSSSASGRPRRQRADVA